MVDSKCPQLVVEPFILHHMTGMIGLKSLILVGWDQTTTIVIDSNSDRDVTMQAVTMNHQLIDVYSFMIKATVVYKTKKPQRPFIELFLNIIFC